VLFSDSLLVLAYGYHKILPRTTQLLTVAIALCFSMDDSISTLFYKIAVPLSLLEHEFTIWCWSLDEIYQEAFQSS